MVGIEYLIAALPFLVFLVTCKDQRKIKHSRLLKIGRAMEESSAKLEELNDNIERQHEKYEIMFKSLEDNTETYYSSMHYSNLRDAEEALMNLKHQYNLSKYKFDEETNTLTVNGTPIV